MQLNTDLHMESRGHMTVPWAFQSGRSWESRPAADMVIIACISCYAVIRRHDQWRIFIIILNYADRWKSCVRVPTCDGWLNWTNDLPCSTAHSSMMPIRLWYLVSEGPSPQSVDQCPFPITVQTAVYATHYDDSRANLCRTIFDPDTGKMYFLFFLALRIVPIRGAGSFLLPHAP